MKINKSHVIKKQHKKVPTFLKRTMLLLIIKYSMQQRSIKSTSHRVQGKYACQLKCDSTI